jgi:glycosyltransferase involved in cell wall biosynthesis
VLEALAMGRPVVTTDAPGCRETVEDGVNGFLVPPREAGPLEAAMERFILEPELIATMGGRSRALAERKFDVRAVNRAIFAAAGL